MLFNIKLQMLLIFKPLFHPQINGQTDQEGFNDGGERIWKERIRRSTRHKAFQPLEHNYLKTVHLTEAEIYHKIFNYNLIIIMHNFMNYVSFLLLLLIITNYK